MSDSTNDRDQLNERQAPYRISPELLSEYGKIIEAASVLERIEPREPTIAIIIELNLDYPGGANAARDKILDLIAEVGGTPSRIESRHHVFANLTLEQVQQLVKLDGERKPGGALYKVWPDKKLQAFLDRSIRAIKADACIRAFGSDGLGIVWAVIDSGVDVSHPHFDTHQNLNLAPDAPNQRRDAPLVGLASIDFTRENDPFLDTFGHGTHVAGIIAGATPSAEINGERHPADPGAVRLSRRRDESDSVRLKAEPLETPLTGVAPRCKLLSLKVLDASGGGSESALLAALDHVAKTNEDGRRIRIHGVNISIGYSFNAEWFAAGQSPICVAVNRLVRTGVVVVAAAGNDGSILMRPEMSASMKRIGLDQSIADPGNAELAITVGSTHPASPHTYGVSYFSSRGPTADGRPKPDLVAPGERILSCASTQSVLSVVNDPALEEAFSPEKGVAYYREESGTSMAAPHVSGAAAAFLSIHREFIGQPDKVKEVLMGSATDLQRKRDFQGAGLVDLLRAIQSV